VHGATALRPIAPAYQTLPPSRTYPSPINTPRIRLLFFFVSSQTLASDRFEPEATARRPIFGEQLPGNRAPQARWLRH
jgi:hypothetical protein